MIFFFTFFFSTIFQRETTTVTSCLLPWVIKPFQEKKKSALKGRNLQLQEYTVENFNGSNNFGTMKICLRLGWFELMSVNHSARSGGITVIYFQFSIT